MTITIQNQTIPFTTTATGERLYECRSVFRLLFSNVAYANKKAKDSEAGTKPDKFENLFFTVAELVTFYAQNTPKSDKQKAAGHDPFFAAGGFDQLPANDKPVVDWQGIAEKQEQAMQELQKQVNTMQAEKAAAAKKADKFSKKATGLNEALHQLREHTAAEKEKMQQRIEELETAAQDASQQAGTATQDCSALEKENGTLLQQLDKAREIITEQAEKTAAVNRTAEQAEGKAKQLQHELNAAQHHVQQLTAEPEQSVLRALFAHRDLHLWGQFFVAVVLTVFSTVTFAEYFNFGFERSIGAGATTGQQFMFFMTSTAPHWLLCIIAAVVFEFSLIVFATRSMKKWLNFCLMMQFCILGVHSSLFTLSKSSTVETIVITIVLTFLLPVLGKAFAGIEQTQQKS